MRSSLNRSEIEAISATSRTLDPAFFSALERWFGGSDQACAWLDKQAFGMHGELGERLLLEGRSEYYTMLFNEIRTED